MENKQDKKEYFREKMAKNQTIDVNDIQKFLNDSDTSSDEGEFSKEQNQVWRDQAKEKVKDMTFSSQSEDSDQTTKEEENFIPQKRRNQMFEEEREAENRRNKMWLQEKLSESEDDGSEDFDSNISSSSSESSDDEVVVPKQYIAKAMELQMGEHFKNTRVSDEELAKSKYMKNLNKKDREDIARLMNQNRARRMNGNNTDLFADQQKKLREKAKKAKKLQKKLQQQGGTYMQQRKEALEKNNMDAGNASLAKKHDVDSLMKYDILQSIDNYEKDLCNDGSKIEEAMNLLSNNKMDYFVKRQLLMKTKLDRVAHTLFDDTKHQYYGRILSIHMYRKYLFVGNSNGITRVFDICNQKESRPLVDNQLRLRVHCIYVTDDGSYCITGHQQGTLVIWSLKTYSVAYKIEKLHAVNTTIVSAKAYNRGKKSLSILSSDQQGKVRQTEITWKHKHKGEDRFEVKLTTNDDGKVYSHKSQGMSRKIVPQLTTEIQTRLPSRVYTCTYCDSQQLVAFAAVNEIRIVAMKSRKDSKPELLYSLEKHKTCKSNQIPYCSWGWAKTPTSTRPLPVCAVAWDSVIQLLSVDEENPQTVVVKKRTTLFDKKVKMEDLLEPHKNTTEEVTQYVREDGYFYSNQKSKYSQLKFVGDGLLAVIQQKKVKLLQTSNMQKGKWATEEMRTAASVVLRDQMEEKMENLEVSVILEESSTMENIKTNLLNMKNNVQNEVKKMIEGESDEDHFAVKFFKTYDPKLVFNNCNSICSYKNNIVVMQESLDNLTISRFFNPTYLEHLKTLKEKESEDWVTVLSVALQIFHGNIQGFSGVPEDEMIRENQMLSQLEELIVAAVKDIINRLWLPSLKEQPSQSSRVSTKCLNIVEHFQNTNINDEIALKCAIQFCISIKATDLLFKDLYQFFDSHGLSDKFQLYIEPQILAGNFENTYIPCFIIQKLISKYFQCVHEHSKGIQEMEKLIVQLNINRFNKIEILKQSAMNCFSVPTLQHIFSCQQNIKKDDFDLRWSCLKFLKDLMTLKREAHKNTQKKQLEDVRNKQVDTFYIPEIDDVKLISTYPESRRDEVFRSEIYTGYKILWIIRKLIKGESLDLTNDALTPTPQAHKAFIHAIGNFIKEEENVLELLRFDAQQFFQVFQLLFLPGKAWEHLTVWPEYQHDWKLHDQKPVINHPEDLIIIIHNMAVKISDKHFDPMMNLINKGRSEILTKNNQERQQINEQNTIDYFYKFVLEIQHGKVVLDKSKLEPNQTRPLKMEKELVGDAIKRVLDLQAGDNSITNLKNGKLQYSFVQQIEAMKKQAAQTGRISDKRRAKNVGQIIERDLGHHTTYDYVKEHTEVIIKKIDLNCEHKEIHSVAEELKQTDDKIIVKALKSNVFSKEDVEKFKDHLKVQNEERNQIKIQLHEMCGEYVVALGIFLNDPNINSKIFSWLNRILDQLIQGENKDDLKQAVKKMFVQQFTRKKNQDLTSIGECAKLLNNQQTPIGRFKVAVANIMKNLAQISCEKTIDLVHKWFNHFQTNLIMNDLKSFPSIQLKYLKKFIKDNKNTIEDVIFDAQHDHLLHEVAEKYKFYLVKYISLLSDQDQFQAAEECKLDYYPINECLIEVQKKKNRYAEAVLQKRKGEHIQAIKIFLSVIVNFTNDQILEILKEMNMMQPDPTVVSDPNWGYGSKKRLKTMLYFDTIIAQACDVAGGQKKDQSYIMGEEGWLEILEYLQKFSNKAKKRVQRIPINEIERNFRNLRHHEGYSADCHVVRLQDFAMRRITGVINHKHMNVSMQNLMRNERLKITYEQIKDIYSVQIREFGNSIDIQAQAEALMEKDTFLIFSDINKMNKRGIKISGALKRTQKCHYCNEKTVFSEKIKTFVSFRRCGHAYHKQCLKQLEKELEAGKKKKTGEQVEEPDSQACIMCKKKSVMMQWHEKNLDDDEEENKEEELKRQKEQEEKEEFERRQKEKMDDLKDAEEGIELMEDFNQDRKMEHKPEHSDEDDELHDAANDARIQKKNNLRMLQKFDREQEEDTLELKHFSDL